MKYTPEDIEKLNQQWDKVEPETMLRHFMEIYGDRIALSSSLSAEDQALTDMMLGINPQARIFSLDTGRLFPETYALLDKTNLHYGIKIEVFCPQTEALQEMVNTQGINLFYESVIFYLSNIQNKIRNIIAFNICKRFFEHIIIIYHITVTIM